MHPLLPPVNSQPQIQAILQGLQHGGAPMGNQTHMPIMQGLGAMQQWLKHSSPAQTRNASNFGILAAR